MIWLEGINDFGKAGNAEVDTVRDRMKEIAGRIRAKASGIQLVGATLTSALNSTNAAFSFPEQDVKRKALNDFIRSGGLFDAVVDFDKVAGDPATGEMKAEFVPESTTGGPGDKLHPNRAGYMAMGNAIDLDVVMGKKKTQASR
jgi:lysophospholipase L1-like esterase